MSLGKKVNLCPFSIFYVPVMIEDVFSILKRSEGLRNILKDLSLGTALSLSWL